MDGQTAQGLRAYGAIRAVCVDAGEHRVDWTFRPRIFLVGGAITIISLGLVAAALVLGTRKKHD